jgi:hypothetical protein
MNPTPMDLLQGVVRALGPLTDDLVFIGGVVVPLYFQDPPSEDPRVTDDVDCVVAALTLPEFHRFEERLRRAGFQPCQEEGAPLCRWWVDGHRVDFMPRSTETLGFGNSWYGPGWLNAEPLDLPGGSRIKVFSLPYFLAAKMEAHAGRGGSDPRLSQDLEDVLVILGARRDLPDLARSLSPELREYLAVQFGRLQKHPGLDEALSSAVEHRQAAPQRRKRVLEFLDAVRRPASAD